MDLSVAGMAEASQDLLGIFLLAGVCSLLGLVADYPIFLNRPAKHRISLMDALGLLVIESFISAACQPEGKAAILYIISIGTVGAIWWFLLASFLHNHSKSSVCKLFLEVILVLVVHVGPIFAAGVLVAWVFGEWPYGGTLVALWLFTLLVIHIIIRVATANQRDALAE